MCSYITESTPIVGSAKGQLGWTSVDTARVYFDHAVHAPVDHALTIDFVNESRGARQRIAVELDAESARALVRCIEAALAAGQVAHPPHDAGADPVPGSDRTPLAGPDIR